MYLYMVEILDSCGVDIVCVCVCSVGGVFGVLTTVCIVY